MDNMENVILNPISFTGPRSRMVKIPTKRPIVKVSMKTVVKVAANWSVHWRYVTAKVDRNVV